MSPAPTTPDTAAADRAAAAATGSLLGAGAALALLLPPFNERLLELPALVVLVALALATCLVLHLVFIGLLARRLGRPAARDVLIALLTLPIGSIVGLVLYEWSLRVDRPAARAS